MQTESTLWFVFRVLLILVIAGLAILLGAHR